MNKVPVKWGTSLRLVIGDMPSAEDAAVGAPFSDGAGRVLEMLLRKAGVKPGEATFLTLLDYCPADERFPIDQKEIARLMREHVIPVLKARPWRRLDVIGEYALRYICGKREGLSTWRGSPIEIDLEKLEQTYQ